MDRLVSVFIPTRGRANLVARAVSSVLAQDYPQLEIVVAVDGPDEETIQVLQSLSGPRPLIVIPLPQSLGACGARNEAIRRASGEFLTGLDDDDEFRPDHVSGLMNVYKKHRAAFVCTTALQVRGTSSFVRHAFEGPVSLSQLLMENVVGNQVLARRSDVLDVGGFDPAMPAWQDYDLWVRLCNRFGAGYRVDRRTYVQNLVHGLERISSLGRIEAGHRKFVEKHRSLLGEEQRLSLELLMYATTHRPVPLNRVGTYIRAGLSRRLVKAMLSDRLPYLRDLYRQLPGTKSI